MAGQGGARPWGSPRPFELSQAEVKPEPRLGAGLARASPLFPAPGRQLEELGRAPEPLEQVRAATPRGKDSRAPVGPRSAVLTLLSSVRRARNGAGSPGSLPALSTPHQAMLPRGRPRALGVAALLLLLLLLIGFFLLGGDPECERLEPDGRAGDLGCPRCPLTPRVPSDGRLRGASALHGDPLAGHWDHNRSACDPWPQLPPKCEVGALGLWGCDPRGPAPRRTSWIPVEEMTPGTDQPAEGASSAHVLCSWPQFPHL